MATVIIRRLEDATKRKLRIRASHNGRSMEAEAREILRNALRGPAPSGRDLGASIQSRFAPLGGIQLPEVRREAMRRPRVFEK